MSDKIFFLIKNNASLQVIYLFLKQKIKNIFFKNSREIKILEKNKNTKVIKMCIANLKTGE